MTSMDEHLPSHNSLNGTDHMAFPLAHKKARGGPLSKLSAEDRKLTFYARVIQELLLNSNRERGM